MNLGQLFTAFAIAGTPAPRCLMGKACYPDKKAAVSERNRRMRAHRGRPDYLREYYCPECRAWHLTKRELR